MSRSIITATLALALAAGGGASLAAKPARHHPVTFTTQRVSLPGEGRGDYLLADEASNRLYVTHTAVIHILDLTTLAPIATVTGLKKAHGVAIAAGKGFASDGDGNSVVVFDPATGATLKTIAAGQNPDSILFDAPSGMVFVFNGTSQDVSVIDPVKAEVVKTIPVGDKPEFSRSDGAGKVYFNMEDEHAIGVIDTRRGELVNKLVLPDCEGPAALGLDYISFIEMSHHTMRRQPREFFSRGLSERLVLGQPIDQIVRSHTFTPSCMEIEKGSDLISG